MVLCVDIGNSKITLGGFEADELVFVAELSTDIGETKDEYSAKTVSILTLHNISKNDIHGAIISSVVPQLNSVLRDAIKFVFGIEPLIVGPGIKTGINIHCDTPSSVGADLICASVAAHYIYGSPSLIVDMGTATKMIAVNSRGTFIGVSIIPGVLMGLNALSEGTAQLPHVSLEAPGSVIAKNTADCMKSGVIFGHASMVDGMIDRISAELGEELTVYATGEFAPVILPHCNHKITLDEQLVLKGLNIIYKKNI